MSVILNSRRCNRCGMCICEAPEVFELADDCIPHVIRPEENNKFIKNLVAQCPTGALMIV